MVLGYELAWDEGNPNVTEEFETFGETNLTNHEVENVTLCMNYRFKIRYKNMCGYGTFSEAAEVFTSTVPK